MTSLKDYRRKTPNWRNKFRNSASFTHKRSRCSKPKLNSTRPLQTLTSVKHITSRNVSSLVWKKIAWECRRKYRKPWKFTKPTKLFKRYQSSTSQKSRGWKEISKAPQTSKKRERVSWRLKLRNCKPSSRRQGTPVQSEFRGGSLYSSKIQAKLMSYRLKLSGWPAKWIQVKLLEIRY